MGPEVSILLPVYNAEQTLETCLRSLLRQRMNAWECVLVDDGSRDRSLELARSFAARDERIRVVAVEHRGLVESLNLGLERCRAAVVARMDADDWMHRDRLATQLRALTVEPKLAAVGTHVRMFPVEAGVWQREATATERALPGESSQTRKGRGGYEAWLNSIISADDVAREAFVECPIAHPTLMIRTDVLMAHRYRDMGWPEDYDLVLRLLAAGHALAVVPRRLLAWRDHESRLSRTSPRYSLERFVDCKALHLSLTLLRGRSDYVLWGYGSTGRMLARALAKLGLTPSHIVELHPRRIGQQILGATVIHPDGLGSLGVGPLVASVAGMGPRREIRLTLAKRGYVEGRDFVCAA
jgi:glycosyltransferase involved in cell wall biosynthesis